MKLKIACSFGLFLLLFALGCSNSKLDIDKNIVEIQQKIDTCSMFYLCAIKDIQSGISPVEVRNSYEQNIKSCHSKIRQAIDSLTKLYMSQTISQQDYDKIIQSIKLDTIQNRSKQLDDLGVTIILD